MLTIASELKHRSSSFEWNIKNFASLSDRPGESYESPPFDFCNATWCILMYPNDCNSVYSGNISVFLKKLNYHDTSHTVFQKMSIKTIDGTDYISCESKSEHYHKAVTWGHREFLDRPKVLEITARDGVLTISCKVSRDRSVANAELKTVSIKNDTDPEEPKLFWKTLVRNFKDSFLQKKNCDVVIKVKE